MKYSYLEYIQKYNRSDKSLPKLSLTEFQQCKTQVERFLNLQEPTNKQRQRAKRAYELILLNYGEVGKR